MEVVRFPASHTCSEARCPAMKDNNIYWENVLFPPSLSKVNASLQRNSLVRSNVINRNTYNSTAKHSFIDTKSQGEPWTSPIYIGFKTWMGITAVSSNIFLIRKKWRWTFSDCEDNALFSQLDYTQSISPKLNDLKSQCQVWTDISLW